jgi:uncharacterized membrane protein HdeD (DUF308 family)
MKIIEKYQKFRESSFGLLFLTIISIGAGLGLLITPETTPKFIIQGVGILWVMEGIAYTGQLILKYLETRIKARTGNGK